MGLCLRGKMTDAGLFPKPADAAVTEAVATPPAAAADVAVGEHELDVTPAVPADDLVAATFGLLRAEPDGSMVIAGSGTPGSEVEVYSNGDLLGKATVESTGDWVLVPDAPIPPGGTEITLAEAGKPGRAAESFVVVINDDKTTQPLVVASTPGAASEVLQGLEAPAAGTSTDVAVATPPVETPAPAPAAPEAPAAVAPAESATAPESGAAPAVTPTAEQPAAAAEPAPSVAPAEPAPAAAAATADTAVAVATPEPAAQPEAAPAEVAATPVTPVAPPAVVASAPPTIDAIEVEGNKSFFAGSGPEGGTIRLYVDDSFVDDAKVADGRWLVEAGPVLTKPTQRIRIDLLEPGSANVASRAEVDFVVDLPDSAPPVAVAEAAEPAIVAPPAAPAAPVEAPEAAPAPAPEPVPTTAAPATSAAPAPVETTPSVPAIEAAAPEAAPAAEAPAEPDAVPAPVQETPAPPAAPVSTPEPAVAAAPAEPVETPQPEVPTMVAVAAGDPQDQRFASGKAIIRRGDNLWTIARRVYGSGVKYTTIYEANTGQIRDPDRIYPGQVFDLPADAQ